MSFNSFLHNYFYRPIAGYVNFCPVSIDGSQSDEYLLTVAKHEVLHALVRSRELSFICAMCSEYCFFFQGFSSGLYRWWRDENGDPRSPRNGNGVPTATSSNTLREVTYNDWSTFNGPVSHTVSLLVTPNIIVSHCPLLIASFILFGLVIGRRKETFQLFYS